MQPELKNCPFCGGTDIHVREDRRANMAWCSCVSCGLEAPTETGVTKEQAVEYWNRRAALPTEASEPVGLTYRHKKRGSAYKLVGWGQWVSIDPAKDGDDVYVAEVASGAWQVRWAFAPTDPKAEWARAQTSEPFGVGTVLAIYRALDDQSLWVRPRDEFLDGRFEPVARPAPVSSAVPVAWVEAHLLDLVARDGAVWALLKSSHEAGSSAVYHRAVYASPPDRAAIIEECAKVADDHATAWGLAMGQQAKEIAKAIRALIGSRANG